MSSRPKRTFAEQLNAAQLAISNSLEDSEIQTLVADYGYSVERLEGGNALYETALASVDGAKSAAGAQQSSTQELVNAERAARDAYQALAKVARAVFVDDRAQLVAMGLRGKMPASTAGFLESFKTSRGDEISKSSERRRAVCSAIAAPVAVEPSQKRLGRSSFANMRQRRTFLKL